MHVRASDADREHTLSALRDHTAAGRLTLDEFAERADLVYAARTLGELASATADLPPAEPPSDSRALMIAFLVALFVVVVFAAIYTVAH